MSPPERRELAEDGAAATRGASQALVAAGAPVRLLRVASEREQAEQWVLVLGSQGLHARSTALSDGIGVFVAEEDHARARILLALYERENALAPVAPPWREVRPSAAPLVASLLLVLFFFATDPGTVGTSWFSAGVASSSRLLHGEPWRAVTALTLHLDLAHIAGNAVFLALFGTALCRSLGPGLGLLLVLLAGTVGNVLSALLHGPGHSSAGASTAVFGAIGSLAMLQFRRLRAREERAWRVWLPLAAGLALLSLLGGGGRADLGAHLCGLLVGLVLGWPAATRRAPGRWGQWLLLATASGLVVVAWCLALARPG